MVMSDAIRGAAAPMRQLLLDLGSPAVPGLDAFITGGEPQNEALLGWLSAWPAVEGPLSPAYIWGAAGSGAAVQGAALAEQPPDHGRQGCRVGADAEDGTGQA